MFSVTFPNYNLFFVLFQLGLEKVKVKIRYS